jgi:hypothetical protein
LKNSTLAGTFSGTAVSDRKIAALVPAMSLAVARNHCAAIARRAPSVGMNLAAFSQA